MILHDHKDQLKLRASKSSVENNFYHLGYVYCFDVCIPHKLSKTKTNLPEGIFAKASLIKHIENVMY